MEEIASDIEVDEIYVEVNGIKLHTIIIGAGDPIILLHGFPDFWFGWNKIIGELHGDFKLIVPDTRGINLSDKPEGVENYRAEILVEDIRILSEKLGHDNFSLVGHDWGGVISWLFAERYPELLKKLVIINAPHPKVFSRKIRKDKKQRKASGYIFELMKPGGELSLLRNEFQLLKYSVFGTAANKDAFSLSERIKYIESWSRPGSILGGVNYYRANPRFDGWSGMIKVPTLVVFGMKDRFIKPTSLIGLEEYVEDLNIIRIEDSSHWAMHDEPKKVAKCIRDFIAPISK